ncbi:hypothetical protein E2562_022373 [Oryza meyeriana var. granulata]|uniref:Uncharacterized protein n=1 Tax=Oryza meyeriana var. granulata TaxID=110450 RepID=A0A6G1DM48_9ORYZ|nr:hypothetical protein E2562_022373 [Oryza meyeriana var. granulata]
MEKPKKPALRRLEMTIDVKKMSSSLNMSSSSLRSSSELDRETGSTGRRTATEKGELTSGVQGCRGGGVQAAVLGVEAPDGVQAMVLGVQSMVEAAVLSGQGVEAVGAVERHQEAAAGLCYSI